MKKPIFIVATIIILAAVAGGSFYGGMVYGKSKNIRPLGFGGNLPGLGQRNGVAGSNFISGNILSKDGNNITLKLSSDAGSKIIFYSSTTQINKSASGTPDDLTTGTLVSITGTSNSDGSVTAQSIQIRNQNPGINTQNPVK
jgi:hypothetical protein